MAYIGAKPSSNFRRAPIKDSFTGDGSTTTFDLANIVPAGGENALQVFIDNVRQEPGSGKAYTLGLDGSGDLKRITFSAAPANSAAIYVITTFSNEAFKSFDTNGVEFFLDADGDTSLTADTDDTIDIKVAGTDQLKITDGVLSPTTDSDIDLGTSSIYYKDAYIDSITTTGAINKNTGPWATKTGTYTAVAGDRLMVDTSGGAFTITLPASPSAGDEVRFLDVTASFDTNNLTIGRNSQKINGNAADLTVATEGAGFSLVYYSSTYGWRYTEA
tara:strand:+ start:127 stop:948 length:822 start_codon:yes stop_codon:yes gene_type:complete